MNDNHELNNIHRILRVDHAGEYGAIHIYRAQLLIARLCHPEIVPTLAEMLAHEKIHYQRFDTLIKTRAIRPCYAIQLWALGGFLLGVGTALLGRNAIFVCTHAIESTVLHHLTSQLDYLKSRDTQAHAAVLSIQSDEQSHQAIGEKYGKKSRLNRPLYCIVDRATRLAIWLSTKL